MRKYETAENPSNNGRKELETSRYLKQFQNLIERNWVSNYKKASRDICEWCTRPDQRRLALLASIPLMYQKPGLWATMCHGNGSDC